MKRIKIFSDRNMTVGRVSPTLFSSFAEQLGRCVYTGLYEPGHPQADEDGFRKDVSELVKGLGIPMVRYPGGNFVSGYDWRDGIGPRESRPARLDLAWKTTESNRFGTDEFMKWCRKNKAEPMMAVNLGTGTPLDAAQLVEYCNHPSGSYYSDLRAKNGSPEPYNVKYWCLGNEMDGPWQTGQLSAEDYSKKALITAKMMRAVDPGIKLVACGSSGQGMPTYPEWDRIVLDNLYEVIDYISMHQYYGDYTNNEDFFASYADMENFIKCIRAACDFVKAKHRSEKTMLISFDEWNVWDQTAQGEANWTQAPHILEDIYTVKHALVFAGMMNTLLSHCDRVDVACLAQLVNVIAPIFTEEGGKAIKQTTYFPFELISRYGRGSVLRSIVSADQFDSKYGKANYVSSAMVDVAEEAAVSIFLVNYSGEEAGCEMELRSFGSLIPADCIVLDNADLDAKNTLDNPDAVQPRKGDLPKVNGGTVSVTLAPYSFTVLRLKYTL